MIECWLNDEEAGWLVKAIKVGRNAAVPVGVSNDDTVGTMPNDDRQMLVLYHKQSGGRRWADAETSADAEQRTEFQGPEIIQTSSPRARA